MPLVQPDAGRPALTRRWRIGVALAIVAAAALLAGCSKSTQDRPELGANVKVGDVLLGDVRVVEPLASANASDRTPTVLLTLANQGDQPDSLTGVTTDVATRVEIRADPHCDGTGQTLNHLQLPAVADRTSPPAERGYFLRLVDLRVGILPGGIVPITFTFTHAGSITIPVPVETGAGDARQPAAPCATAGTG